MKEHPTYPPAQFQENRTPVLLEAIGALRFGAFVTSSGSGQVVSHLPVVVGQDDDDVWIDAHVARSNEHWRLPQTIETVAIFQGPHAYVRPRWLSAKRLHGRVVPTWNYVAVHAHGMLEVWEDREWLRDHLAVLSDHNETGRAEPWALKDAPQGFVDGLLPAIVGLRLRVTRLTGIWKMSQHHSPRQRAEAAAGLRDDPTGDHAAAVGSIMLSSLEE